MEQGKVMDQGEIVKEFVVQLGKMTPPVIDKELVLKYVTEVVVDSDSLGLFFMETDRYVKHSQTFQMGFLLHSLCSILMYDHLGSGMTKSLSSVLPSQSAVDQVTGVVATDVFNISEKEGEELKENDYVKRYDNLCQLLMTDRNLIEALNDKMDIQRKLPKIEDVGKVPNPLFDPLTVKFSQHDQPGDDLTEQTES